MSTHETVETVPACQAVVRRLERESYVAVDSEGVNLSRTGPITLLQVGTASGRVFLFDILREPRMFKDGGLKRLLESEAVVKVLHSARNDAEALHAQHGVELHNVHDTQLARMEMERAEGRAFPHRLKLEELCEVYCSEKADMLKEGKDTMQTRWNKTEGDYWAKRPLTQEMIKYAANDVIAIVPEVYLAQKQLLEDKGLTQIFRTRVERDVKSRCDKVVRDQLQKEDRELIGTTLRNFAATASGHTQLQDITDDNVSDAIAWLRLEDAPKLDLPQVIRDLKLQQMQSKLDEIEGDLQQQGADFEPNGPLCSRLRGYISALEDGPMKQQAERLQKLINKIILDDVKRKYTVSTPVAHVPAHEKRAVSRLLRPTGKDDPDVHPVHLHLHWAIKLEELEENMKKFEADPHSYTVSEGYTKVLRFYLSGPVPARLKERGTAFLNALEEAGKIRRPRSGASRGFRGGGHRRY